MTVGEIILRMLGHTFCGVMIILLALHLHEQGASPWVSIPIAILGVLYIGAAANASQDNIF